MPGFVCESRSVDSLLRKLYSLSEQSGVWFHPGLNFICKGGEFSVIGADGIPAGQIILQIPASLFVPVEYAHFGLKGRNITVESYRGLTRLQSEIIDLVVEIYNAAGKFSRFKESAVTKLYFEERELFEAIMRRYRPRPDYDPLDTGETRREAYLRNFMTLRTINVSADQEGMLKSASLMKGATAAKPFVEQHGNALIPFAEYFNHYPKAYAVNGVIDESSNTQAAQIRAYAARGGDELFIRYGFSDTHQQYICQGYVDENSFFTRSVPMAFEIPGFAKIKIGGEMVRIAPHKIPQGFQDLAFYFPNIEVLKEANEIRLGSIKIPMADAPQSVRRILRHAFEQISQDADMVLWVVLYAERQILQQNIEYYERLQTLFASHKPKPACEKIVLNIRKMLAVQLRNIRAYPFFNEAQAA